MFSTHQGVICFCRWYISNPLLLSSILYNENKGFEKGTAVLFFIFLLIFYFIQNIATLIGEKK